MVVTCHHWWCKLLQCLLGLVSTQQVLLISHSTYSFSEAASCSSKRPLSWLLIDLECNIAKNLTMGASAHWIFEQTPFSHFVSGGGRYISEAYGMYILFTCLMTLYHSIDIPLQHQQQWKNLSWSLNNWVHSKYQCEGDTQLHLWPFNGSRAQWASWYVRLNSFLWITVSKCST